MFWSSEDRVRAPFHGTFSRHGRIKASFILLIWLNENVRFHYAESRQNKPLVNLGGNLHVKSEDLNGPEIYLR